MERFVNFFLERSQLVEKLELNFEQEALLRNFLLKFANTMVDLGAALEQSKELEAKVRSGEAKSYSLEEMQQMLGL